jgi:hypothetical protein
MMRELREYRLVRISLALAVAILASSLAAASDDPTQIRAVSEPPSDASSQSKWLSKFDYLVLASMADSVQPFTFTMAGYRDSDAADGNTAVNASGHPINKRILRCHL